ncbi:MAG: alpha/beta hydrolase [Myxococcales bacterium]|nr:alpha/beta hydrolase [Myxococcales bacterium]
MRRPKPTDRLEPKRYAAETRDGWRIALYRYKPERPRPKQSPVLLCHGLGSNRFDLDAPNSSLAVYLAEQGFDVWVIELRGAGSSTRPGFLERRRFDWNFDDYLYHDLPAAISLILKRSRAKQIHWVGHSMGGMLAYAYLALWGASSIRSVVTVGSPAFSKVSRPLLDGLLRFYRLARPLKRVPNKAFARAGSLAPRLVRTTVGRLLANPKNLTPREIRGLLRVAVEDIPTTLLDQFAGWYKNREFSLSYGTFDYRESLREIRVPVLIVAGAMDWLTPPEDLRDVHDMLGSPDKTFLEVGRNTGFSTDFGHIDLILGRSAQAEVFPRLSSWLLAK